MHSTVPTSRCWLLVLPSWSSAMSGSSSTEQAFNPDIFSFRRIKVAPVVCFVGFISMIYAIIHKPKDNGDENTPAEAPSNNEEA